MAIKARTFNDAKAQAKTNPELLWWVFMRLSGTFLVVLTFFHLWKNYIMIDEQAWGYEEVLYSYAEIWNRVYLVALLTLGLGHGANGLRYVIEDTSARSPAARFWIKAIAYSVIAFIFVFGLLALFYTPIPKELQQ